jgi:hypothetical protein
MLQPVQQINQGKPTLVKTFKCYSYIIVQVIGAATLYLAESDNALITTGDAALINALQINQASGIQPLWWKGDLWAIGSIPFSAIILIPGVTTGSGLEGATGDPANVLHPGLQ